MAKIVDENGFWKCPNCKLTKTGVFPYLNKTVGVPGKKAEDIVWVYRPYDEITNSDVLEKLNTMPLPLTDEHEMLGEGATPAEQKGVDGVFYNVRPSEDGESIIGDLTIYSETMKDEIEHGKKELSLGYYVNYEFESGVYNGKHYDAIQRNIKPNHLALVKKGRAGSDVKVMDSSIMCFDSIETELCEMADEEMKKPEADETLNAPAPAETVTDKCGKDGEEDKKDKTATDENEAEKDKCGKDKDDGNKKTEDESDDDKKTTDEDEEEKKPESKKTEDADLIASLQKEIAELKSALDEMPKTVRQDMKEAHDLAESLSNYIGTFDSADMTSVEVASYGCKKLGLDVEAGMEKVALKGFLLGASKTNKPSAMDNNDTANTTCLTVGDIMKGK